MKHVTLPASLDDPYSGRYWSYFLTALKATNTWNLHTLTVGYYGRHFLYDSARGEYFECLEHLRSSIRSFMLTERMITGGFGCFEGFEKLVSLIIDRNIVDNLAD